MKYVSEDPVDFTNDDWMQYTPRERARKEEEERQRGKRRRKTRKKSLPRRILETLFQILIVVLAAYVLVYTFGQQRTVVGQSMDTTLSGGDTVLIDVMAYQISSPGRNSIISFKPNGSSSARSDIKRVIGIPGDTIQIVDGQVTVDGQVLLENSDFPAITSPGIAKDPIRLGEGEYFVLGDNRNNSEDSRNAEIGIVTSDMIEGKVWFVLSPSAHRGFV